MSSVAALPAGDSQARSPRACAPATDPKALRDVLGRFATGVTIITARDAQGRAIGMTANSFTSVSLDPPLVLWSLSLNSANLQTYRQATHFAINVLSLEQQALCQRFAKRIDEDRFDGVNLLPSDLNLPLLDGSLAHLECAKWAEYEVGDHLMFLGRVERFKASAGEALIFQAGRFCAGTQLPTPA